MAIITLDDLTVRQKLILHDLELRGPKRFSRQDRHHSDLFRLACLGLTEECHEAGRDFGKTRLTDKGRDLI